MSAVAFDTYKMVKRLRDAGFTDNPAEAVTAAVQESGSVDLSQLATKADLVELRAATKADLTELRAATKADLTELRAIAKSDLAELRATTKADLAEAKSDILRWMFAAMAAQTALLVSLTAVIVKVLGH